MVAGIGLDALAAGKPSVVAETANRMWQSFGDPVPNLPGHVERSFATELREAAVKYLRGALVR